MSVQTKTTTEVFDLIRRRRQYARWQEQTWSLPGEPLVGIVSATQAEYWHQLARHIAFLDAQIAAIREAVA
jgi:hypothetical protein